MVGVVRLRSVALFLLAATGAVRAADAPAAVEANEKGITHLLAGRASEAIGAFEAALAAEPDAPLLKRNLAAALAARAEELRLDRRVHEAIGLLERATALHPERLRYRVLLGRVRFESGLDQLRDAARDDFRWVLERDPEHLDALVNLGQIAYVDRDLEAAVRLWSRALELKPRESDLEARLAKANRELDVEQAFLEVSDTHFRVRYSPSIDLATAQEVLALCQQARGELSVLYQSHPPRIAVTLYTPAEFANATRMHGWVAGLSDGTIRLTARGDTPVAALRGTIYHELTHHIVRGIAPNAPLWLHEGLAQIEEGKSAAQAEARLRLAGELDAGLLAADVLREADPRRVSLFYDVALAFTRHLGDTRRGSLHDLLRAMGEGRPEGEAIRQVYGAGRDELFDAWRQRLRER